MTATTSVEPVSVAIARDPALVRTARLVAAAVARRAGLDEVLVEEIRLAVGEACAVMIGIDGLTDGQRPEPDGEQVVVRLTGGTPFVVEVAGRVAAQDSFLEGFDLDPWGLLRGIDEGLAVEQDGDVCAVRLAWHPA